MVQVIGGKIEAILMGSDANLPQYDDLTYIPNTSTTATLENSVRTITIEGTDLPTQSFLGIPTPIQGTIAGGESRDSNNRLAVKVSGLNLAVSDLVTVVVGGDDEIEDVLESVFQGKDTITGSTLGDLLKGYDGNDRILGNLGNDTIFGGDGKDVLIGGNGADTLNGDDDSDFLTGAGADRGRNSIDTFAGGKGNDRFILANAATVFYDDGKNNSAGLKDYALIKDFKPIQDTIVLEGETNSYIVSSSPFGSISGQAIYKDTNGNGVLNANSDELIAIVRGTNTTFDLNANYFTYL
jgi:Ca2+-binding RTX toxin-like protein